MTGRKQPGSTGVAFTNYFIPFTRHPPNKKSFAPIFEKSHRVLTYQQGAAVPRKRVLYRMKHEKPVGVLTETCQRVEHRDAALLSGKAGI
jgi:hypothetical protein